MCQPSLVYTEPYPLDVTYSDTRFGEPAHPFLMLYETIHAFSIPLVSDDRETGLVRSDSSGRLPKSLAIWTFRRLLQLHVVNFITPNQPWREGSCYLRGWRG
ncbi:hypothetical protein AFLA_012686 [Aspergillus flavus NRRL3357]|nr:hypothetical protein AFLA_012686 [Aspergillus flavus NRRL3357]